MINPNDILSFTRTLGYWGIGLVIFAEMGLFFCFFLPGDSLLFAAGLLCAGGIFDISIMLAVVVTCSVAGYVLAYFFGDKLGHWLQSKEDTWYYKRQHLDSAHQFVEKHGGKAVLLARMVPIVRTFTPIVAGMGEMVYARFLFFTIAGAVLWAAIFAAGGYFLGQRFPFLIDWLLPVALIIVIASILPGIVSVLKRRWLKK